MRILEINIQNFRKLLQCHIEFSEKTTLFVGANNSGKTSAMDALGKFLADRNFTFNDITISERSAINVIGERWIQKDCEEPTTITEWESLMPKMDIWLNVASNEMHYVACIIPTLKWRGGKLGVRLAFFPKDIVKLFTDYRDAYFAAREVEKAKENVEIRLYPINLSEFLEKNLNTYFSIRLNPLIEKLCIPTLVIADIDSAEATGHHKAICPERGKGFISSNYTITKWLIKEKDLDKLLSLPFEKKEIFKETPYKYSVRVAYQTPVSIAYEGNDEEAIASTFEDCLVYTNYQLFKTIATDDTGSLIKSVSDGINIADSFETFHKGVYDTLRNGKSDQKAEFALDLIYAVDPNELIVPAYIDEGLKWLQAYLDPEE